MQDIAVAWAGYLSATAVLAGLLWVVATRPVSILRPSVMFLGLFWLQVQFSSALNHETVVDTLGSPWVYVALVHLFPILILAVVPFTFGQVAGQIGNDVAVSVDETELSRLLRPFLILLATIYLVLILYLSEIPFNKTGLYATIFFPDMVDQYREYSMKLVANPYVTYSFAVMEKVLAPLAAGFGAFIAFRAAREGRRGITIAAVMGILAAGFPTLVYGARGPISMVVAAALMTVIVLFVSGGLRPVRLIAVIAVAIVVSLLPISLISTLKSEEFSARALVFHAGNIVDRALGRGYIDNVWHVRHVEQEGFHGLAGIEKLAGLMKVEPKDVMNVVGKENASGSGGSKNAILALEQAPKNRSSGSSSGDDAEIVSIDVKQTVSAGASFVVLNYALFGLWSLPLSVAFVLAMDLLLYAFKRFPRFVLAPVIGALLVPVLSLCFSFVTTVLATKGLLLIPATGWLLGQRVPWLGGGETRRAVEAKGGSGA